MNKLKKISNIIKADIRYLRVKYLPKHKYPDFLKKEYKKRTGNELNLNNPSSYSEKIQFAKLYENSSKKTLLTDKYLVRDWVSKKIGPEYLIPLLGVWENFSEIDFNELPNKFVLKTNHSSGWNIIVKDKEKLNYSIEKLRFNRWIKKNYAFNNDIQLHYKKIEPRILAERYIEDSNKELNDYRFMCFNGEVYYCIVDIPQKNAKKKRNVYNLNWELQEWQQGEFQKDFDYREKPENFDKMIKIAKILCEGFPHVRVDLYNVDGKIYFGEMTFTSGSGFQLIYPESENERLGDLWDIYKS